MTLPNTVSYEKAVSNSAYYRQLIKQQWNQVQKKAYPIVGSTAEKAREAADAIAASGDYDLIFVDLPGTVESTGVFRTIVNMDYVLTPTVPDLIVMQSTLSFATTVLGKYPVAQGHLLFLEQVEKTYQCGDSQVIFGSHEGAASDSP